MVKWHWVLLTTLLAGCALIDAANGDGGDDDDEPIIVIDDDPNNAVNNDIDPNNEDVDPNNDDFTPFECAWQNCGCTQTGCDPATDCTSFGCTSCRDDDDCESGDVCQGSGRCGLCETYYINNAAYYTSGTGEVHVCEYDSSYPEQFCLRLACYPEFQN